MVTKLAPRRFASLAMGAWFFSMFISDLAAGFVAGAVEKVERGVDRQFFETSAGTKTALLETGGRNYPERKYLRAFDAILGVLNVLSFAPGAFPR